MKTAKLMSIVAAVILPFFCLAQTGGGKLDMGEIKSSKVKWGVETHDFGNIPQNKPVTVAFELENTGNAPLLIQKVEASCGCTTADYQKAPIMPGQKAKVGATFDAKALGKFSKSLTVTLNDGNQPYTLRFSGTVVGK